MVNDAASPALDRAHLARQTFGDEALAREVLGLFLQQSTKLFAVIAGATGADAERRDAAHGLKGAALGVGAFAVADTAQAVENNARQDAVPALAAAIGEARAAIDEFLRRPGDGLFKTP